MNQKPFWLIWTKTVYKTHRDFRPHCGQKASFIFQFTITTASDCPRVSTGWEEPVELKFLGP